MILPLGIRKPQDMKKVITSLPEEDLAALDELRGRQNLTRSEAVSEAIRWYVRVMTRLPPAEDTLPDEVKAIEQGQQQIARGEYLLLEDLKHDMAGPAKQSGSAASGSGHR